MSSEEREAPRAVLYEPRFADRSPGEIVATLLDDEKYLGSERTMYRLLAEGGESRERRNQRSHPVYTKPELVATAPNEVWTCDIERHEALSNRAVMKGHGRPSVAADGLKLRAA